MEAVLFNIPLAPWVQGTIEWMNAVGADDSASWNRYWLETYVKLRGDSKNSGSKGCPRSAAYGLWQLGRISRGGKPVQNWSMEQVREVLGKNATYVLLTLNLLNEGRDSSETNALWDEVRAKYQHTFAETAAGSEQGAVRVASILFAEGHIISTSQ